MILGEDEKTQELNIDPKQPEAYKETTGKDGKIAFRTLNPTIGYYKVMAEPGPGYSTQRQEAFDSFSLIMTQNPSIAALIGDIMLRAGDFPFAGEAAERLKRMVPKEALGEGPSQAEQQLKQQVATMQGTIQALMDQLVISESKLIRQGEKTGVEKYKAFTERVKAILDSEKADAEIKTAFMQSLVEFMGQSASTTAAPAEEITAQGVPPIAPKMTEDRQLGNDGGMLGQRFMSGQ